MPGLYKNKRKRLTTNSSQLNNTSIWHSTAIETSGDVDKQNPFASAGDAEDEEPADSILSPPKRPALGEGVSSSSSQNQSQTQLPIISNGRIINTPIPLATSTPAAHLGPLNLNLHARPAVTITTPPSRVAAEFRAAEDSEEDLFADQDEEVDNVGVAVAVSEGVQQQQPEQINTDGQRLHISQRFGPVVINPPSGHTFFASILHKNGFILALPKNHLREDVMHFRKNLEDWLKQHNDENSRIENETDKFLKAVDAYFIVKDNLKHSLTTTLNDKDCIQPSLLNCLLGVKFLQARLLGVIFTFLSEAGFGNTQEDADFVHSMMNQMKWLPYLVDGKNFAMKLMDVFENATCPVQKQMVRLLPEIFPPEFHPDLIPRLMIVFDMGTTVNVPMLDCFSSLVVPEEDCIRIRRSAVDQMTSAPLSDLPAYFAFLLRVGTDTLHLEEGINEMREKVEIAAKDKNPQNLAIQVEILERIRFCVSVNTAVIKIWNTKIKDDLGCEVELKTLDLIMLLVFAESGEKTSIKILESLFKETHLANNLFDKMLKNNKDMLFELFQTLARFIDSVLRTKDSKCHEAASSITNKLFVGLGPVKSQYLMINLIGVLVNGHPICRDVTLKIFTQIAENDPKKLLYFHSFLMGALVYVIKFPPRQMQALMNVLAIMAFVPETHGGEENSFTLEFMILLRKQITSTNLQLRSFGVLGTMAAVRQLATHEPIDEEKIDELLNLAWDSTQRDEEACGIFLDELASCANILPLLSCKKFKDVMNAKFESMWTIDQASESQIQRFSVGQAGLELEPTFDANKEMQRDQLVIVLESKALEMSPLVVPAHLRTMVELEKSADSGVLDGVDAILGSPVFFPSISRYYDQVDLTDFNFEKRLHLGQYLIITINFFRECISAFVVSDNPELRIKVWLRISNVITLQKILVKHFNDFPNLPLAYGAQMNEPFNSNAPGFSGNLMGNRGRPGAGAAKKPIAKPPRKKRANKPKKGAKAKDDDGTQEDAEEEANDEIVEAENPPPPPIHLMDLKDLIQPKYTLSHLRRLDPSVFNLIKYPLKLSQDIVDFSGILLNLSSATQSTTTMEEVERFNPESLALILIEIQQQIGENKVKIDILVVKDLLTSLCSHVDVISDWFQNGDREMQQQPMIDSCLRLILKTMKLYFEAIASLKDKNKKDSLIDESVLILASRYKSESQLEDEDDLQTQLELLNNVSKYLCEFAKFVSFCVPSTAEDHVRLLKAVHDLLPRKDQIKKEIGITIKYYLCRKWKLPSGTIDFFLKTWFAVAPSKLQIVKGLTKRLLTKAKEDASIPNCDFFKTCSKLNFHTWYSAMFTALAQHVHQLGRRRGDFEDSIEFWNEAIPVFSELVILSVEMKNQNYLTPLLKQSRVFIEAFTSGGACLLPELWKRDQVQGLKFTKPLQSATRRIQNICEHSKVIKSNQLMKTVPAMKKALETLVFRVREVLANYGAANAFWMGSLKLKSLDGGAMSSQPFGQEILNDASFTENEDDNQEEEEEVGDEDEDESQQQNSENEDSD